MSIDTESQSNSQNLSSSHSSLGPSKKSSSEISKTYKHASQLFLTRRLAEAYEALQPVVKPPSPTNGHSGSEDDSPALAPIATATTSQRIKIWSLYVTLLNSIADLGDDEGKQYFGPKEYRDIVKLVQSGEIWEQVVRDGYRGREGSLDAEVVYNLSTLLLGQAPDQKLNQSRLETYLSSPSHADLDLSAHLNNPSSNGRPSRLNGTSTPKDLTSRIKILELFTLHVLPRNEEWDYARSFVANSDVLDEERREAFLQTLQELQEAKEKESWRGMDEEPEDDDVATPTQQRQQQPQETQAENGTQEGQDRNASTHQRTSSEVDYGIEKAHPNGQHPAAKRVNGKPIARVAGPLTNLPPQSEPLLPPPIPTPTSAARSQLSPPAQTPRRPTRKPKSASRNVLLAQVRRLFLALSSLAHTMAGAVTRNPTALLRMLVFLVALLMVLGRREVREQVRRVLEKSWTSVKRTVGMGVKVSYI